jgi:hypothetical protein
VVIPDEHENVDALAGLLLKQLTERDATAGLGRPAAVSEQHDLRVHRPPNDVNEVIGATDGIEDVFPTK